MTRLTVHNFLESDHIQECLREIELLHRDNLFEHYDNPFERKLFLAQKDNLPPHLSAAFNYLRSGTAQWWIGHLLEVPVYMCDYHHYGGLFIYRPGDYLKPHVDAGKHPKYGNRKIATALLYLTNAELEFYTGDKATADDPLLWSRLLETHKPGDLVIFTNHDGAWHGVPPVADTRVCLTVSYLADSTFSDSRYQNQRTRAYFARTTWEAPIDKQLREARASEEHHAEVYRTSDR